MATAGAPQHRTTVGSIKKANVCASMAGAPHRTSEREPTALFVRNRRRRQDYPPALCSCREGLDTTKASGLIASSLQKEGAAQPHRLLQTA
ncbi:hypothetical protein JQ616_37540 [Bradyrhizobium tropiciagri]|nr:hypothetical protein [Bradyrhizobium tropiciagri]